MAQHPLDDIDRHVIGGGQRAEGMAKSVRRHLRQLRVRRGREGIEFSEQARSQPFDEPVEMIGFVGHAYRDTIFALRRVRIRDHQRGGDGRRIEVVAAVEPVRAQGTEVSALTGTVRSRLRFPTTVNA